MTSLPESAVSLPKSIHRAVASVGHVVASFVAARAGVLKRAAKAGKDQLLRPWLPTEAPLGLVGEGLFAIRLATDDKSLRLRQLLVPVPEFARGSEAELVIPEETRLPVWAALFKLRMLREYWELEMRSNLLQSLDAVLPVACLVDPTPLPPGAVIGGLGLSSWEQLPSLRDEGRSFDIHGPGHETRQLTPDLSRSDWAAAIREALAAFPQSGSVLCEATPLAEGREFVAIYRKSTDRVDLHSITSDPQ